MLMVQVLRLCLREPPNTFPVTLGPCLDSLGSQFSVGLGGALQAAGVGG